MLVMKGFCYHYGMEGSKGVCLQRSWAYSGWAYNGSRPHGGVDGGVDEGVRMEV